MTPTDIFGLMREIASNPDDDTLYQMYADHLEESGNEIKSQLVRGTKIEPEWQPLRYEWLKLDGEWKKHQKGKLIYQPEHSNYYKVYQLMATFPELCLNRHMNRKMYCSQRGTRFTFRWKNGMTGTVKSVLLLERGLVREMWLNTDAFMAYGAEIIACNPVETIHLIDRWPQNETGGLVKWHLETKLSPLLIPLHVSAPLPEELYNRLSLFDSDDNVYKYRAYDHGLRGIRNANERAKKDLRQSCLSYGIDQAKQLLGIA